MSKENEQKEEVKLENILPYYMNLYPKLEVKKETKILSYKDNLNNENNKEEDDEKYDINETFLEIVLKKPISFGRNKIINTISKCIQSSNLSKKLITDYNSDKKVNLINICNLFAQNLNYSKLEENNILYRMGEKDSRLFFILSGRIQKLKLKEIPCVKMTNLEYLNYCKYLYKKNEIYILNEVISHNNKTLPFISDEDVVLVSKINFMYELLEKIKNHSIANNSSLIRFFHVNDYTYDDFDIEAYEINSIEQKKLKKIHGAQQEWEDYIKEKCSPTEREFRFYEPFNILLKSKQQKFITCFIYESESYLEPGDYFGELTNNFKLKENMNTIRAQTDSVLAWIKNSDYLNIIDPKRKIEKIKEISFLHNYFFFKEISGNSFEKNYYENFTINEYNRGTIIYKSGDKPKNLLFLKKGKLYLEIKCTIIDLFFIIKDLYNNLISNPIFVKLPKAKKKILLPNEAINILKKSAYDDNSLKKLIRYNPHFFEELKKTKTFQISELNGYEIVGLEEVFLNTPYIMKCTVNDKKAICYEFPIKNISRIIKEGNELLLSFVKTSINKIISLIKRLDNIKNNSLYFSKLKFDYNLKINQKETNENGNNECSINNNFTKYNNDSIILKNLPNVKNPNNTSYDNYSNSRIYTNTEASNINNNNLFSFDSGESHLNSNNSFYKTKSPFKKSILSNTNLREVIILHKKFNKTNNFSHSNSKNYTLTETTNYRQSRFRNNKIKSNKNNIFLYKNKDDENKNEKESNKELMTNNLFYQTNTKKDNILLLGKNKINIDYIKKDINDFLSCDNSDKYVEIIQSNKVNNNFISNFYNHNIPKQSSYIDRTNLFHKKNFRLSLVPLNKLNIYTDNNKSLDEKNKSHFISNYKDMRSITDFVGISSSDKYSTIDKNNPNTLLPKLNLKFGLVKKKNYSMNKDKISKNKKYRQNEQNSIRKILKREDGKDMIKEYYNDIKKNGYLSFIPNKEVNTIFMRKFNKKYRDAIKNKKNKNNG